MGISKAGLALGLTGALFVTTGCERGARVHPSPSPSSIRAVEVRDCPRPGTFVLNLVGANVSEACGAASEMKDTIDAGADSKFINGKLPIVPIGACVIRPLLPSQGASIVGFARPGPDGKAEVTAVPLPQNSEGQQSMSKLTAAGPSYETTIGSQLVDVGLLSDLRFCAQ